MTRKNFHLLCMIIIGTMTLPVVSFALGMPTVADLEKLGSFFSSKTTQKTAKKIDKLVINSDMFYQTIYINFNNKGYQLSIPKNWHLRSKQHNQYIYGPDKDTHKSLIIKNTDNSIGTLQNYFDNWQATYQQRQIKTYAFRPLIMNQLNCALSYVTWLISANNRVSSFMLYVDQPDQKLIVVSYLDSAPVLSAMTIEKYLNSLRSFKQG